MTKRLLKIIAVGLSLILLVAASGDKVASLMVYSGVCSQDANFTGSIRFLGKTLGALAFYDDTANISDSVNKRFITDAQRTILGNTSGANSGDQTITLTGDVTGSGTGSFAATLANSGVTAATYARANVTFDAKGRATSASSGIISSATSFYVATTGSDSTGDGSSSSPWATVAKAMEYLQDYDITAPVYIYMADGTYSSSSSTSLFHRHGNFINIVGTNVYTKSISSVQSSSGSAGAYSIVFNLADVSNIAVGDYINISGCSGGTNPKYAEGCWPITAVDSANKRITVTCTNITGVPSGAVVSSTAVVLKAIVDLSSSTAGAQGWTLLAGVLNSVQNIAFTNSGSANGSSGLYIANQSALKSINTCGFSKTSLTAYYMSSIYGGTTQASAIAVSSAIGSGGILVAYNSQVRIQYAVISGVPNTAYGVLCQSGGELQLTSVTVSNCNTGLRVQQRSEIIASSATITGCYYGVYSYLTGTVTTNNSTISNCTTGITATSMSFVYAASVSFSGNTTNASPAVNTNGNSNSYIQN